MKMRNISAWVSACYLTLLLVSSCYARLWTDSQGRTIDGELESATAKDVTVVLKSGKKVVIPLARLSSGDRFYVDVMREELAKGTPTPGETSKKPTEKPAETTDPVAPPAAAKGALVFPETLRYPGETLVKPVADSEGRHAYASGHVRVFSDVELKPDGLDELVLLLESTRMYWNLLGLPAAEDDADAPSQLFLFSTEEDYVKNGGNPGALGTCRGTDRAILVCLESSGIEVRGGRIKGGNTLDMNSVVIHEMIHQLTPRSYSRSSAAEESLWLIEGLAEYARSTPYSEKKGFTLAKRMESVVRMVSEPGMNNDIACRGHGTSIKLPRLGEFINADPQLYDGGEEDEFGERSNLCYSLSCMMVTHFLHTDRGGDMSRFRKFLRTLATGVTKKEAVEVLLDGDNWERIEEEMAEGFKKAGLKLKFGDLTMEQFSSLK
jgi:hypothetical protein